MKNLSILLPIFLTGCASSNSLTMQNTMQLIGAASTVYSVYAVPNYLLYQQENIVINALLGKVNNDSDMGF